jgi:hypothetical protein
LDWKKIDARKKRLKWKGEIKRAKAGAKNERSEQELEGRLPPFFWFFFGLFSCVFCFLYVWEQKDDGNVLSFFCVVLL